MSDDGDHLCCISHEFFRSASQNPNKVAVIHAGGGIRVCRELLDLHHHLSGDVDHEEVLRRHRKSSDPPVYGGDVCFTYGDVLSAVDSLSRRLRRALDGLRDDPDVVWPGGELDGMKRPKAQAHGWSGRCSRLPHIVGVKIGPSVEYIVAVLSILRCGEAFLPLDPSWSEERVISIARLSNVDAVIVCRSSFGSTMDDPQGVSLPVQVFASFVCPLIYISMERTRESICQSRLVWPCKDKDPRLFCYLMYTSGSTGMPKGVCGSEAGLMNRFSWMQDLYPARKTDVFLFKTSVSFIDHVQEMLSAILSCTPLVIPIFDELKENPFFLVGILEAYGISRLTAVPSLMKSVVPVMQSLNSTSILGSLKLLVVSGEIFSISLWELLSKHLPETPILNLYGSTEVSGDCSYFNCTNLPKLLKIEALSSVPIGTPIPHCEIILHGESEVSDEGEVYVSGSCLFVGYFQDICLGLYNKDDTTGTYFKTGDFARRLQNGDYVFTGRRDRMVKLSGHRVSLEEIENMLRKHPEVKAAAVTSHRSEADSCYLKAYIVQQNMVETDKIAGREHSSETFLLSIRSWLLDKLPLMMVPSYYFCINELPLLPTGKVDYVKLGGSAVMEKIIESEFNIDRYLQDNLQVVKEVFSEALLVEEIKDTDNFFSLGGNSISAAQVAHRLGIGMRFLYLFPCPSELVNALDKVSFNIRENPKKRLKLQDIHLPGTKDWLRNISEDSPSMSQLQYVNMDLNTSNHCDGALWTSSFIKDWTCSLSRCNHFMYGSDSGVNNMQIAGSTIKISKGMTGYLQETWRVSLESCVDASPLLVVKDGLISVLIGSHSHIFVCVDGRSGVVRWKVKLEGRVECSAAITADFSKVVVGCYKGNIYFIDILSGYISWTFHTDGEVKSQPIVHKDLIWCGSHDHLLYALDHRKCCCIYKISCGGSIYGTPAVDKVNNILYAAATNGRLTAISTEVSPFCMAWSYESGAPIFGSPCIDPLHCTVICCLVDGNVLALNSEGSLVWKVLTGGPIFAGACFSSVLSSQVLVCSRNGTVYSFDVERGGLLWEYQIGDPITSAAYVDEHIQLMSETPRPSYRLACICSSSGSITILKIASRTAEVRKQMLDPEPPLVQEFASLKLSGDVFSSPVMIGGRIFVGCRDDHLHCLRVVC